MKTSTLTEILRVAPRRITGTGMTALVLLAGAFVVPAALSAATLNGNLDLSSDGAATVAVNGQFIDFDYTGGVTGSPPIASNPGGVDGTGDTGLFDITGASNGSFGGSMVGTQVTIHDLSLALEPTGVLLSSPLVNFITFATQPTWKIALTEILPGVDGSSACGAAPSPGQICTPPGSPFNLQNEAGSGVSVTFSFMGTATNDGLTFVPVFGQFDTGLTNTTFQAVEAALSSGQAIVSSAHAVLSLTPVTTVPEPKPSSMIFLGLLLISSSVICRRYQRR